jgi:hypothetical protein
MDQQEQSTSKHGAIQDLQKKVSYAALNSVMLWTGHAHETRPLLCKRVEKLLSGKLIG